MGNKKTREFQVRIDRKVVECMDITVQATSPRAARARAMALMNAEVPTIDGEHVQEWRSADVIAKPKIGEVVGL